MTTPRTTVVLVGQNPTPALLSALTLPSTHLTLIASDDTAPAAHRVAVALERLSSFPRSIRVLSVGPDPHDPRRVYKTLEHFHAKTGGRPWRLDYTGGTKVMSVVAALFHEQVLPEDSHPGSRRLRHYLDATHDLLRSADSSCPGLPVHSKGVDLATLAEIHGAHWREDRDPEPVRLFVQGGRQALMARYPDMTHAVRRGVVTEGRVVAHLRRHLRRDEHTEVLGPRQVVDPYRPERSIADFDAVVRHRHRVLCVETKTRPDDVIVRAGWTVAKARRVFGQAVSVLFVHAGPAVPHLREEITAYNPALSARNVHVWTLDDLLRRLTSFEDLRKAFFPGLGGTEPTTTLPSSIHPPGVDPPEHHPGHGDDPVLVTSLGGSRLGTLTAIHAHRPTRALILSSKQGLRGHVREAAARILHTLEHPNAPPADAARLKSEGYHDRVRFTAEPVDGSDADAVADTAHRWITEATEGPVVVDFTTGTKAMSLGLALAARRVGACATYQLARRRSLVCLTHGELPLRGRAGVDWSLVLPDHVPLNGPLPDRSDHVDTELLQAARETLERAARGPVEVWTDTALTGSVEAGVVAERPSLILTFDDRAVGLAAPAWRRTRGKRTHTVSPGAWAQSVFAATMYLNLRCDVAGTVVALTRPGGDVSRAVELVDWITHTDPDDRREPAGLRFGDPLHPLVATADPDMLPDLLDVDVGGL